MRIFLDVGAHYGETLDVAINPRWGFRKIYSFEPSPACQSVLRGFRDSRLQVVPAGLSNKTGSATLFGSGLLGASVYADKGQGGLEVEPEEISLVRATDWLLANTSADDEVYLKLNCEGSECDVLEDLLESGAIDRIRSVYVDFDVQKIPSQAHRQTSVEERLRERGTSYVTPDRVTRPAGNPAVKDWLTTVVPPTGAASGSLRYRLGLHRPPYMLARSVARNVLPYSAYVRAARRFGTQASAAAVAPRGPERG